MSAKGYLTQHQSLANYYTKGEVNNLIDGLSTGDGEVNLTNYYTKDEVNNLIPKDYLTEIPSEFITETELNKSLSGYAKLTDIPTDYIKSIPSEYITETELNTSLNGYSTTSHTHSEYITEQYDDTALANRISALESELTGVSELISKLNDMIV